MYSFGVVVDYDGFFVYGMKSMGGVDSILIEFNRVVNMVDIVIENNGFVFFKGDVVS